MQQQLSLPFKKNFKIGNRVQILSKSTGGPLKHSIFCKKNKNFGYVTKFYENIIVVNTYYPSITGDYFLERDLKHATNTNVCHT